MKKGNTTKKSKKNTNGKQAKSNRAVVKKSAKSFASSKAKSESAKSQGEDIINLILADHKPLKKLIKIMKDSDKHDLDERQQAFEEFAPLLVTHAKPEEQTMYVFMKEDEELREGGFEGEVEHTLADQLLEEIKRTDDQDVWSAKVKVLAELVEHHIEEEEDELLPGFKKHSEKEDRLSLGREYLRLKQNLEDLGGKDSPEEGQLEDYTYEEQEVELR